MIKRALPIILIILGSFILLVSFAAWWSLEPSKPSSSAEQLPKELAGLELIEEQIGTEALNEVSQLHGKEFKLASGAVGIYKSAINSEQITLWVTGALDKKAASSLVRAMSTKISEGNSPFRPTVEREIGERIIYELEGMGAKHFYYQSGVLVVWLAADPKLAEQALLDSLNYYP